MGASDAGGDAISAPSSDTSDFDLVDGDNKPYDHAISNIDVLGKYDPEKGCFGPGDFHIPKPVFKKPLRRPYYGIPVYVPPKKKKKKKK